MSLAGPWLGPIVRGRCDVLVVRAGWAVRNVNARPVSRAGVHVSRYDSLYAAGGVGGITATTAGRTAHRTTR